jgi:FkbM family methyltransferase
MNNILTIDQIETNGIVHFTFNGDDIQDSYEVSIIDENTDLTVHKSFLPLKTGVSWWISTGESNAKRLKNVRLKLQYGEDLIEIPFQFKGENRYLVIDSKQIHLSNSGDDLFPIVCEIFYDKIYERDFVKVSIDDVIVDIGANYGVFSLYSQMFKPKKVYSVEPVKSTFENMEKNLDGYGVICINKAISNNNGFETFALTNVNGNNFSLKNIDGYHPSEVVNEELVETITIDQLISDYNIPYIDFLKVDCEGGELDLFQTINKNYLKNNVNKIALEYHSPSIRGTIIEILINNGFVIEDIIGSDEIGLMYAYNYRFIKC